MLGNNKIIQKQVTQKEQNITPEQQKLYEAIKANDLFKVQKLLKEDKIGPNFKIDGYSMLFWAVTNHSGSISDDIVLCGYLNTMQTLIV